MPAISADELTQAVHDNLRNLGVDVLDVVNLRSMFDMHGPAEGSIEEQVSVLAELQRQGLVRHIGLSNVTPTQIAEGRADRRDRLRAEPVQSRPSRRRCSDRRSSPATASPMCRFSRSADSRRCNRRRLMDVAQRLGATPMQVALAWLLHRSPNILLIPGTSSLAHLSENLAAAELDLPDEAMRELDGVAKAAA